MWLPASQILKRAKKLAACPRSILLQGLEQLKQAVEGLQQARTKA